MRPPTLDDLVARIADGEPVDWSLARQLEQDPEARELIAELQAIERLHDSHRSFQEEGGPWLPPAPPPQDVPPVEADDTHAQPWGKYRLLAKLGAGSFGTVFRGRDDDLHRDLAIKLLHDRGDGHDRPRLLREAQDLARIRHANVVTIYAVEQHDARVGLCMELIEGRTLDAVLRQDGPLNAEEATAVGQAVGRGLAAIHQAGLLHRDVNAKNVMRERAGRYVLMDLGAGLDTTDAVRVANAGMAGTPLYMAPEVLAGGAATVRSDIYSLGVLLYFLVTGRHPVEGRSREDITRAHGEGKRTFLTERRADLPEAFVRCVERALSREPLNRHGSTAELLVELGPADGVVPTSRPLLQVAAVVGAGLAAFVTLLVAMGALSSTAVNYVLSRPVAFAPETMADWFKWGRMASIPFIAYFLMTVVVCQVARAVAWLIAMLLRKVVTLPAAAPPVRQAGAWLLSAVSVAAVIMVLYTFWDLMLAFTTRLDDVQTGALDVLSPGQPARARRLLFGRALPVTAAMLSTGWYLTWRSISRHREQLPWGAAALGASAVATTLAIWASAYQVFWHTDGFLRATFDGQACLVVGETTDRVLLHCSHRPVGEKALTVEKTAPLLKILETRGSPYSSS